MVEISSLSALFCTCKGEIILLKAKERIETAAYREIVNFADNFLL